MPENPYDLVRAKDSSGHEMTVTRAFAQDRGLTVTEKPTRDAAGAVIPDKLATTKDGQVVTAASELYDPATETVDAVVAHLGTVDADEAQRILDAEAAGKDRVGITSWTATTDTTAQEA